MSMATSWNYCPRASRVPQCIKNLPAMQETQRHEFDLWVRKIPWRRKWQPTPVFLPRKKKKKTPMDRGSWQATVHGVAESNMTED